MVSKKSGIGRLVKHVALQCTHISFQSSFHAVIKAFLSIRFQWAMSCGCLLCRAIWRRLLQNGHKTTTTTTPTTTTTTTSDEMQNGQVHLFFKISIHAMFIFVLLSICRNQGRRDQHFVSQDVRLTTDVFSLIKSCLPEKASLMLFWERAVESAGATVSTGPRGSSAQFCEEMVVVMEWTQSAHVFSKCWKSAPFIPGE